MQTTPSSKNNNVSDSVEQLSSFRDVVLKIQAFSRELYQSKWWIMLSMALIGSVSLIRTLYQDTTYPVNLTFVVKEESGSMGNSASAVLGQLAFGKSLGAFNLEKIVELTNTKNIVHRALFNKVTIEQKEDFLANHLIDTYDLQELWKDTDSSSDTQGTSSVGKTSFTQDSLIHFSLKEHEVFNALYHLVVGTDNNKGIMTISYQENTGFLAITVKSVEENLSIELVKKIYKEISEYYVQEVTEKPKHTFKVLQKKADSIFYTLKVAERQLANATQRNQGFLSKPELLKEAELSREVQILTIMYGEVLKNKETSAFLLENQTPLFQVIDRPFRPIRPERPSKLLALLLGIFVGGFLAILAILGRRAYLEAMSI